MAIPALFIGQGEESNVNICTKVLIDNVIQQKRILDKEFIMGCFVFSFHFSVMSPSQSFGDFFVLICEAGKLG